MPRFRRTPSNRSASIKSWRCSINTASRSSKKIRPRIAPAPARRRGPVEEENLRDASVAFADDGDGKHTDDPVRMYLTQMGEIPLLDRGKEISLAKKIEVTRRWFRGRKVLECDFALREVITILNRVHREELPFDRTIKISQTEKLEKDQILKRMPFNLRTVEPLMEANIQDFEPGSMNARTLRGGKGRALRRRLQASGGRRPSRWLKN